MTSAGPNARDPERGERDRVTLKSIGQSLGVSITTVSRALRDDPGISELTRNRVKEIAETWAYVPNRAGAALSTGKTYAILFVVPYSLEQFPRLFHMEVLEGLVETVSDHGYNVNLVLDKTLRSRNQTLSHVFRRGLADGGVLLQMGVDETISPMRDLQFPIVIVNQVIPGARADFVVADDRHGGFLATEHLIKAGHTDICHFTDRYLAQPNLERLEGYRQALQAHDLPLRDDLVVRGALSREDGYRAAKSALERGLRFTAAFCCMDLVALGAIQAFREFGLRIPEDISIVGFDDDVFADVLFPPLTTIRKPRYAMGETAGRILINHIVRGSHSQGKVNSLETSLIVRESVAPPRAD